MFQENLVFYGKYSDYITDIVDLDVFERLIDIVILAANIGILFDKKGINEPSQKNKREIFATTINNESENFKMLSIIAYLKNTNPDVMEHTELFRNLFLDLENSSVIDTDRSCLTKYNYLKEYIFGGLEFLENIISKGAYDKTDKIKNLEKLFTQLNQINSKGSIKIIESLMG